MPKTNNSKNHQSESNNNARPVSLLTLALADRQSNDEQAENNKSKKPKFQPNKNKDTVQKVPSTVLLAETKQKSERVTTGSLPFNTPPIYQLSPEQAKKCRSAMSASPTRARYYSRLGIFATVGNNGDESAKKRSLSPDKN